jgi:hypothetical protein
VADHLAGQAMIVVALGAGGRGHVWRPIAGFGWLLRAHHRSADVTGQEGGSIT